MWKRQRDLEAVQITVLLNKEPQRKSSIGEYDTLLLLRELRSCIKLTSIKPTGLVRVKELNKPFSSPTCQHQRKDQIKCAWNKFVKG